MPVERLACVECWLAEDEAKEAHSGVDHQDGIGELEQIMDVCLRWRDDVAITREGDLRGLQRVRLDDDAPAVTERIGNALHQGQKPLHRADGTREVPNDGVSRALKGHE